MQRRRRTVRRIGMEIAMTAKWMKSSGWAALVAGLALAAVPANAQDREWRGRGGGAEASAQRGDSNGNGNGRNWWRGRGEGRAEQRGSANAQEGQVPRSTRDYATLRGNGGNWNGRDRAETPRPVPQAPVARQAEPQRDWSGRNRSYVDPQRNRSYRDAERGNWRDNDNRWNGRDRNRWSGSDRRWDRDWRRNDRYDWSRYRSFNRNTFRLGSYYAPYRNYSYRRVGIGFSLDALFFGSRYWISDPWQYRLPEVYGPYRWVRYYDDVLLVDTYTGEVVDVIYDFFW